MTEFHANNGASSGWGALPYGKFRSVLPNADNVRGLLSPARSSFNIKIDRFALPKCLVPIALDCGEVAEDVFPAVTFQKTKTFSVAEPRNRTLMLRHFSSLSRNHLASKAHENLISRSETRTWRHDFFTSSIRNPKTAASTCEGPAVLLPNNASCTEADREGARGRAADASGW